MIFQRLVEQVDNNCGSVSIPGDWAQGRTVFGGISVALVYVAIKQKVADDRVLRSLNTNFVAPLAVDVEFHIEVEILREGGSVTQVLARAIQNQQTCVLLQASFGKARESRIVVTAPKILLEQQADEGRLIPHIEGITPAFLKHFDLRTCSGGMPFSDSKQHSVVGWMRSKKATGKLEDERLIALIDTWPPTTLQMYDAVGPSSSLSWNLEFMHPHQPMLATDWLAYSAITRQAAGGYAHTEADIRNQAGELVAISRQVVVVYQ